VGREGTISGVTPRSLRLYAQLIEQKRDYVRLLCDSLAERRSNPVAGGAGRA
jgi:hypothetical protein